MKAFGYRKWQHWPFWSPRLRPRPRPTTPLARRTSPTRVPTPSGTWWLGEDSPYVKFTDGVSDWAWGAVTGWQGDDNVAVTTITIDLGSVKTDIARVRIDQFVSESSAVFWSSAAKAYGSTDGTNFSFWADMTTTATVADNETMWYWVMENQGFKTARYVRVEELLRGSRGQPQAPQRDLGSSGWRRRQGVGNSTDRLAAHFRGGGECRPPPPPPFLTTGRNAARST